MASTSSEVGAQPLSFSQTGNLTLKQYRKDIGFMVQGHRQIEAAKGDWLQLYNTYKAGKFPKDNATLQTTMNYKTDAYLKLESATERAKALLDRFNAAIEYSNRPKISKETHVTYQRSGYKVHWAKQEELLLGQVVPKLKELRDRVNAIWSHMNDRLPKAGANLGAAFYYAYGKLGQTGFGSSVSSNQSWLDKAIAERQKELGKSKAAEEPFEEEEETIELSPEQENDALATLSEDLQNVIDEDPFTTAVSHGRKGSRDAADDEDDLKAGDQGNAARRGRASGAEREEEEAPSTPVAATDRRGARRPINRVPDDAGADTEPSARSRAASVDREPEAEDTEASGSNAKAGAASSDVREQEAEDTDEAAAASGSNANAGVDAASGAPQPDAEETDGKDGAGGPPSSEREQEPSAASFASVAAAPPTRPTRPPLPKGPPPSATDATGGAGQGGKKHKGGSGGAPGAAGSRKDT